MAQSNPQGYLPDVAGMLNNLESASQKNKFEDALKSYKGRWRFTGIWPVESREPTCARYRDAH